MYGRDFTPETFVKNGQLIEVSYAHHFDLVGREFCGYAIPCTKEGKVLPDRKQKLEELKADSQYEYKGIVRSQWAVGRLCDCGSGFLQEDLYDAQGVYVVAACKKCKTRVKARYAPWVWNGYDDVFLSQWSGERIEEDE